MKEKELAEFLDFISALKDKADLLQKLRDVDIELEQIKWRNKKLESIKRKLENPT